MENDSTFNVYTIGPRIAELQSLIESEKYFCKIADYNAIVWDWNEQFPWYMDTLEASCVVLTTDKQIRPVFGENLCLSHHFDNLKDDDTACIGMIDYNHPYKSYQNIKNDNITFYDYSNNEKTRLIKLPNADIIYGYIDNIIDYMKENDVKDLSTVMLKDILNNYVSNIDLNSAFKLLRKKDV